MSGDTPFPCVVALLRHFWESSEYEIWILSGRRADTEKETLKWLENHGVCYDFLQLRKVGDRTQDYDLKIQWAEEHELMDRILFVLEDRQRMVDAWREKGVTCFQVRPGNF